MNVENILKKKIGEYLLKNYSQSKLNLEILKTRKEFDGHYTIVLFPIIPLIKKSPQLLGIEIGEFLKSEDNFIIDYNVVQGFLNLVFDDSFLIDLLKSLDFESKVGKKLKNDFYLIEFSSPNTNKPLHIGHIRNILLGDSVSKIFQELGNKVHKTQIINDRGIHICKSMVAWIKFGNNSNPKSENMKGDVFVGNYYVKYNNEYEKQVKKLVSSGKTEKYAKENAKILLDAKDLLRKWENGDKEVIKNWNKLNSWVYEGFSKTYDDLNIEFDSEYYESNTYLKGKDIVTEGLKKNIFFKKDDNSVWIDLTNDGLDEKILLRSDGTSVYMTQDLGTAYLRYKDHPKMNGMIYTTGNEQDYHFKVLFQILEKLGYPWAKKLNHLSYGMVDLPSGKMKSREGRVVDADELINEMYHKAKTISESLGKVNDLSESDKSILFKDIALGALKYHILKVDPKKRILFDPNESIDFNGNTGPFIQYTYARIQSLLKNNTNKGGFDNVSISNKERNIIIHLNDFDNVLLNSYNNLNPSLIANYVYDLVKLYNSFYQSSTVLGNNKINSFRLFLSKKVGDYIKKSMYLLGIKLPKRM